MLMDLQHARWRSRSSGYAVPEWKEDDRWRSSELRSSFRRGQNAKPSAQGDADECSREIARARRTGLTG